MSDRASFGGVHPVVLIVAAVLASLGLYSGVVRDNLSPRNFGVVDEGRVYRSAQLTPAALRQVCDRYKIKTVIDLGSYWDGGSVADARGEKRNQRVAESLRVTRYVMPLEGDGTGNLNVYVHALRILSDPAAQPVLVHCGAGSERTGVAVALYQNLAHGVSFEDGLKDAAAFHHNPRRNPHVEEVIHGYGAAIVKAARDRTQLDDPAFPPILPPRPVTGGAIAANGR